MRIALIQQHATRDKATNLARGLAAFEAASRQGAQAVGFAELAFEWFYPQRPAHGADLHRYGCQVKDQRVLADVARHIGDVVAAVAAPTKAAARAAALAVEVEYEELPAVFDPLEALDAPPLHEQAVSAGEAVSIDVRPMRWIGLGIGLRRGRRPRCRP